MKKVFFLSKNVLCYEIDFGKGLFVFLQFGDSAFLLVHLHCSPF